MGISKCSEEEFIRIWNELKSATAVSNQEFTVVGFLYLQIWLLQNVNHNF